MTALRGLYRLLTAADTEQYNLGLEDCRHAVYQVFPLQP